VKKSRSEPTALRIRKKRKERKGAKRHVFPYLLALGQRWKGGVEGPNPQRVRKKVKDSCILYYPLILRPQVIQAGGEERSETPFYPH